MLQAGLGLNTDIVSIHTHTLGVTEAAAQWLYQEEI
jgi:hypothetical protein